MGSEVLARNTGSSRKGSFGNIWPGVLGLRLGPWLRLVGIKGLGKAGPLNYLFLGKIVFVLAELDLFLKKRDPYKPLGVL